MIHIYIYIHTYIYIYIYICIYRERDNTYIYIYMFTHMPALFNGAPTKGVVSQVSSHAFDARRIELWNAGGGIAFGIGTRFAQE